MDTEKYSEIMRHNFDASLRYAREEIKKIRETYAKNCKIISPKQEGFIKLPNQDTKR